MSGIEHSQADHEALAKRRVPCMVAYLNPFRLVIEGSCSPWKASVDDINALNWDYVGLHTVVGGIDVGLPAPYHMIVGRDGAVGLPILPHLREQQAAVEFFNRCFAALLLGGVYCEAIGLDGVDFGSIIDWKYLRVDGAGVAGPNQFHRRIRLKVASPFEAISLVGARELSADALTTAMASGRAILGMIPELSGEFILKGATGFARRDWGTALSNLWIVVEQITSNVWGRRVIEPAKKATNIAGRVDQLADTRSWTIAARHELLHQIGAVSASTLALLSSARKARNALAHRGLHPTESDAQAAYSASLAMIEIAAPNLPLPLGALDLRDHTLSDPFKPRPRSTLQPTHWMDIPKLPGERELELQEALRRQAQRPEEEPSDGR